MLDGWRVSPRAHAGIEELDDRCVGNAVTVKHRVDVLEQRDVVAKTQQLAS